MLFTATFLAYCLFSFSFLNYCFQLIAVCSPACVSGLHTACTAGVCKCGTANQCSTATSNMCNSNTCKCGFITGSGVECSSTSTLPSCLDNTGNTPTVNQLDTKCRVNQGFWFILGLHHIIDFYTNR